MSTTEPGQSLTTAALLAHVLPERTEDETYQAAVFPYANGDYNNYHRIDALVKHLIEEGQSRNAYFALATFPAKGRDRKAESALRFQCVWVDLDCGPSKPYSDKDAALKALAAFSPGPTAIVDSGRGLHVYWRLAEPIEQPQFPRFKRILDGLMEALKGDPKAALLTQILRPPGTRNIDSVAKRKDGLDHDLILLHLDGHMRGFSMDEFPESEEEPRQKRAQLPGNLSEGLTDAGIEDPSELNSATGSGFRRSSPWEHCPICGGHQQLQQGRGIRCAGYILDYVAFCTREEVAGGLSLDFDQEPPAYKHRLFGDCSCGRIHGSKSPHAGGPSARRARSDNAPSLELTLRSSIFETILDALELDAESAKDLTRRGLSEKVIRQQHIGRYPVRRRRTG